MSFKMQRVHVWSGSVADEPGGVAAKLAILAHAGANLEYVYTQRLADESGMGLLCVAPILGAEQQRAAKQAGLSETSEPVVMRLEGDNDAGLASRVKQEWAKAGINLHGSCLSVCGKRFIGYITFDSIADANEAARILAEVGRDSHLAMASANGTH
ncbi:amino acid-binding ACT [Tuwongella immobilis]|uniref:Marine sediment metagenome DNA, contig: S01H1_S20771 n=1 Tax=Tuwongella immobilis TaxID=692036 RepID=A0A6C2YHZ3_9BACT